MRGEESGPLARVENKRVTERKFRRIYNVDEVQRRGPCL